MLPSFIYNCLFTNVWFYDIIIIEKYGEFLKFGKKERILNV